MTPLSDNLRGALLMMGAMACFTVGDTVVKVIGGAMPLAQLLVLRGTIASVLVALMAVRMRQLRLDMPRHDRGLIALRTVAEAGAAYFFLTALLNMPIANVTALLQMLPLTLTLAGAALFRETVGWRRWTAIGIGFCGMLLIVRPGTAGFDIWSLYALAAVVCVTVRDLATRRMSAAVPSLTVTLAASVGVTLFAALWSLGTDWVALTPQRGLLVLATALCITGGYALSVAVMRVGEIGFVSPFRYTGLVWALVLGFLVFGEWPAVPTLIGAAIIMATGIFTLVREAQTRRRLRRDAALRTRA